MAYEKLNLADGDVLKAEHLAHMETEMARQKSWNELGDRPFGVEPAVFVPEQTFTDEGNSAIVEFELTPEIGVTLTMVFDGQTYVYETMDFFGSGVGAGNDGLIMGEAGDGGPFVAWVNGQCMVMAVEKNVPHTIKITGDQIIKIPNKYYDKKVSYYVKPNDDSDRYLYKELFFLTKVTNEELSHAVNGGMIDLYVCDPDNIVNNWHVYPYYVNISGQNYGIVRAHAVDGTTLVEYYTAEYTPPETT